ncbi:hypothetical protein A3K73_03930 [Candidatus Pacearchaeota archaeon RBG_13_36_9]|nr:MAG: hypothetical protein A3K73_03930 [Candidatus Pacearchaeota archaeon RBG_13_36_9]
MESETGALLTKISAIINFVVAGIIFLIGIIGIFGLFVFPRLTILLMFIFLLVGLIVLIFALLLWNAAVKMKNPRTVKNGAIWAIVLGALTLGNVTGILALVGGIIALIESDKMPRNENYKTQRKIKK